MPVRAKTSWWLAAIPLVLAGFLAWPRNHAPEPVYQGKPVSYWFREAGKTPYLFEDARSSKAFRELGATAVPYLATELTREEPWWSKFYAREYPRLPARLQPYLAAPPPPDRHQETAAMMLYAVGLPARAALRQLVSTYDRAYARHFLLPLRFRPDWPAQLTNPPAAMLPGGPVPLSEGNLREWILMGLIANGGDDPQVAPMILCAIQEPDPLFRISLPSWIRRSTNLVSAVALAEPAVLRALHDPIPQVGATAATMLGMIARGHPEVIPPLIQAAEARDPGLRQNALESLLMAKPDLQTVLNVVALAWTDDNNAETRHFAGQLLFQTAGPGAKSFAAVSHALDSADARARAGAARLLGEFGARAKATVPKLKSLTSETTEPDAQVRLAAAEALKKIAETENPQ
jgi:hypothetical protein